MTMIDWRTVDENGNTKMTILSAQHAIERLQAQVLQVAEDNNRLLGLIEQMSDLEKIRARAFDLLSARVAQLEKAVRNG